MALPTLYCKSKTGKTQVWNIEVIGAKIRVSYGYEGGAVTVNEKTITAGKNLGKKNATTAAEQAALEAKSTWDKKKTGDMRSPSMMRRCRQLPLTVPWPHTR
jgi:hypothetical protein